MNQYQVDDIVEIDIGSCEGLEPKWVPAFVTEATAENGRTMATVSDGIYVGLFSRDGWGPDEIRPGTTVLGWKYTYSDDGRFVLSAKPIRKGDSAEKSPEGRLQRLLKLFSSLIKPSRLHGGQTNG